MALSDWLTLLLYANVVVSGLALIASWMGYRRSGYALRLAQQQELRRVPKFDIRCETSKVERDANGRLYSILVSIRNQSDSQNTFDRLELLMHYRTPDGTAMMAKIPSAGPEPFQPIGGLGCPIALAPHGAVTGWVSFRVAEALNWT